MHKSTIHRLLQTLESKRFVVRDSTTGLYQLGFRFIELASVLLQEIDIQRWALPYLQHLSAETGETVDLAVLDGNEVIYLQVVETPQRVKIAAAVGQRLPVACTATGKAFLAFLPLEQVHQLLGNHLDQYTDNTLVSFSDLYKDLEETRQRGFAISEQEYENDINAVAAPIIDVDGCPLAVIAIVGPSFRMPYPRMLEIGQAIQNTARALAGEMGLASLSVILPKITTSRIEGHSQ